MIGIFSIPEFILSVWLMIINITAFFMYGIDKRKARKNKWRIKEKTLIITAYIGGAMGAFVGMLLFHHKTKHVKFVLLVPLALIIWIVLAIMVFVYL